MSGQPLLINLKIRSITLRRPDEPPTKIDNGNIRFTKILELATVPKVGSVLELTAGPDRLPFQALVNHAAWDDRENMFIVACSYMKSPMSAADYVAISTGGDWTMKPLL